MIEKIINDYSLYIFKDQEELTLRTSSFISNEISNVLKKKERFQLCLCGGSTPKDVYKLLSKESIPWEKVDVFLGDERCVMPSSSESNTLMIKQTLLKNLGSKSNFYEIFKETNTTDEIYKDLFKEELKKRCAGVPPSFDFTLLGLGDDGHTASLFPFKEINESDEYVIFSEGKGIKRISLTPKILSASSQMAFLLKGSNKQIALKRLIDIHESSKRTPAKLIKSKRNIIIFCDLESSKKLSI